MARWVEREDEAEEEEDFEEESCCGCGGVVADGFGGFAGFEILGPAKLMVSSWCDLVLEWDVKWKMGSL